MFPNMPLLLHNILKNTILHPHPYRNPNSLLVFHALSLTFTLPVSHGQTYPSSLKFHLSETQHSMSPSHLSTPSLSLKLS